MIGTTISHYHITEALGSGGMGIVYAAEDMRLGRTVAIKFLPEMYLRDDLALERFRREARAASALNHPHICTVYDMGEHDGRPFIVMERLRGATLADRITVRPLRIDEILDAGIQLTSALETAHAAGIIHRDLKPANIFLSESGQLKVLDFGVAKLATEVDVTVEHLTSPGVSLGTIAYMSPEQLMGDELDARTDLFSAGIVLYQLISGTPPFKGGTAAVVIDGVLHREPHPLKSAQGELPELQRIVMKALEKDKAVRYQTAADMRADLVRVKRDRDSGRAPRPAAPQAEKIQSLRLVHPWEAVARDGREFAEEGSGMMYWFRVPLGGVCYPDGFRSFLQPALENDRIGRLRFVLDSSESIRQTWSDMVLPLIEEWAAEGDRQLRIEKRDDGGHIVDMASQQTISWIFVDLSQEFTPCFKLFVDDPASHVRTRLDAQVFLATATRTVRLRSGAQRTIRIPDTILRAQAPNDEAFLLSLNRIANQWDLMFS